MSVLLHHSSPRVHRLRSWFSIVNPPFFLSSAKLVALPSTGKSKLSYRASFKCCSSKNESNQQQQVLEGFSALGSDIPWEADGVWSTMALYLFSLHIPLSFGGLSAFAQVVRQSNLDPKAKAMSVLLLQTIELFCALLLLGFTAKPGYKLASFFLEKRLPNERNWLFTAVLGFIFLILIILLTSYLAESLMEAKAVNSPALKEILFSGNESMAACILVYCIITPMLEEIMYRGFLLTSLASKMKWQEAVVISSVIFSAAHLSGENFLQLFTVGGVLGCCYCWTGNLRSSILLHSVYNALILLVTYWA
ncbi:hypothetical protein Dimus_019814 [Dionaea muscipula]